jgi:hypothetical protein
LAFRKVLVVLTAVHSKQNLSNEQPNLDGFSSRREPGLVADVCSLAYEARGTAHLRLAESLDVFARIDETPLIGPP